MIKLCKINHRLRNCFCFDSKILIERVITQINVQFVVQTEVVWQSRCICVFTLSSALISRHLSHLVRPITIGEQISSCDLMIRDRLSLSQQGQIDVTRVTSCRQTAHTKNLQNQGLFSESV